MVNVLPRVYCGVSEGIPFAANAARRIYAEMLEMAPLSKVMYGSDGFNLPEINYIGAKLSKAALAQALEDLVSGGMLSQVEAEETAGLILAGNARRLYGLESRKSTSFCRHRYDIIAVADFNPKEDQL